MADETMLDVSSLHSGYGRIPILAGVTLRVARGEFVGILGHNGMGKTTLLQTLMGYLPATAGHVSLLGRDITALSPTARARLGIGYVPQGREIFPALSVRDNLRMGCLMAKQEDSRVIDDILGDFPRLRTYLDRLGGALSGGEQQLLALARCLCGDPQLLLLDEPTEGIQPSIVSAIEGVIASLKGRMAILLVEQYYDFARTLADRYVVLERGGVAAEGLGADMDRDNVSRYLSI